MTSLIVAKRYAKALLSIGKEDGKLEQYGKELAEVVALFDESAELESVLANPGIEFESRQKVLGIILGKAGMSPIVSNFLRLLMDKGRMDSVRSITAIYTRLTDEEKGITRATVYTAASMGDAEISRLAEALKKVVNAEVQLEVEEDPSLIGGVVARIGDLVLDGSVKRQLENLKDSLKRGDYA